MVKAWINEDGYREKGYRERKLAELEAKSKSKKTTVTKDMTENDIMKVWDNDGWEKREMYTDQEWREECEQRSKELNMNRVNGPTVHLTDKAQRQVDEMLRHASKKQYGGDHYLNMGVQVWDVVDTWPIEQQIGYYRGGNLKYIMRLGNKDERLQEAKKALHYAEKLVEVLEQDWEEKHGNGS